MPTPRRRVLCIFCHFWNPSIFHSTHSIDALGCWIIIIFLPSLLYLGCHCHSRRVTFAAVVHIHGPRFVRHNE